MKQELKNFMIVVVFPDHICSKCICTHYKYTEVAIRNAFHDANVEMKDVFTLSVYDDNGNRVFYFYN